MKLFSILGAIAALALAQPVSASTYTYLFDTNFQTFNSNLDGSNQTHAGGALRGSFTLDDSGPTTLMTAFDIFTDHPTVNRHPYASLLFQSGGSDTASISGQSAILQDVQLGGLPWNHNTNYPYHLSTLTLNLIGGAIGDATITLSASEILKRVAAVGCNVSSCPSVTYGIEGSQGHGGFTATLLGTQGNSGDPLATPLPASALLLGAGLGGFGLIRRRG